jgi:hypothetical protein
LGNLNIVVEEYIVLGVDLCEGAVVAFGEAVVAVEEDETQGRVMLFEECDAVVGRAVVGNDDLGIGGAARCYGGQETFEVMLPIPVEYDNSGFQFDWLLGLYVELLGLSCSLSSL